MFDTLRFADRLKNSGFESRQAEGMARAIGDEFAGLLERVATKSDLEAEIGAVRTDLRMLDAKVDALDAKLDARVGGLDTRLDALGAQVRFMFAILALLLALGLFDTVPRILS